MFWKILKNARTHARTPTQTKNIQTSIIQHARQFIPAKNIVILEAPPLLSNPNSDIYPYNNSSYLVSQQLGSRFAKTLIGEFHIFRDGFHIQRSARHLLIKSVAAAIANVDPHNHFNLPPPPYGNFGPWAAPNEQGFLPPLSGPNFLSAAVSSPINVRRTHIRPLMDVQIPRVRHFF